MKSAIKYVFCAALILILSTCAGLSGGQEAEEPLPEGWELVTAIHEMGRHGGYNYELWRDSSGRVSMILKDGGAFSCKWSGVNNVLFRKGVKYNETQTHGQLGEISVSYECDYKPSGNSYMGIYGWTTNPLVEYYILDSWGSWKPPGGGFKKKVTVGGEEYEIFETKRTNQPSIKGTATFPQYWSIRVSKRTGGTIPVSEHFKTWEELGMKMGKMYEVAFVIEGYQSSGSADLYKHVISVNGEAVKEDAW